MMVVNFKKDGLHDDWIVVVVCLIIFSYFGKKWGPHKMLIYVYLIMCTEIIKYWLFFFSFLFFKKKKTTSVLLTKK